MKLGVAGIVFFASLCAGGCAATPTPVQQERVAAYGIELAACIAAAKVMDAGRDVDEDGGNLVRRASSCACRERVEHAYGRLDAGASLGCPDGGAP